MKIPGSITLLVRQMRSSDAAVRDTAAQQIWQRYYPSLLALARRRLERRLRRREDEHDVLQSMYASFCFRQQRGEFSLANREGLWRLLVQMTVNKTRTAVVRHGRERRDYKRDAEMSNRADQSLGEALALVEEASPTPAEAAEMTEQCAGRLAALPEPLRQIALWKWQGYTNEEIARPDRLCCTVRTVERKLRLIREIWATQA